MSDRLGAREKRRRDLSDWVETQPNARFDFRSPSIKTLPERDLPTADETTALLDAGGVLDHMGDLLRPAKPPGRARTN